MRAGTTWEEHTAVIPYVAVEADRRIESDTNGAALVVEARLSWGGSVLALTHASPKAHGALRVRDLDLPMRSDLDLVVARRVHGQLVLVLPSGEVVPSGCQMTLRLGRALLRVSLVPAETSVLPRSQSDGRVAKGVALGAVIHGAVLAIAVLGRAPIGEQEAASQAAMSGYLAAIEARTELADATQAQAVSAPSEAGREKSDALSSGKKRDEGAAGNPARVTEGGLAARTRGVDRFHGHPGTEKPETFGMIALLTSTKDGDHAGSSAFADFEGPGAMGSIFGAKIDDAPGFGGLGLSGPGEGGGGKGAGVPLAGIGLGNMLSGTCDAKCQGTRAGRLSAHGISMRGTHTTRSPRLRCGVELDAAGAPHETCATQVNGRLPPEAIQRVVRQSFGRLRACYEAGLQRDPGLEGRIAVKFVIDREGAVSMASVADRDLPDAEVAACVARAYTAMSFPKPEGGIVTVVYPVVFGS